MLNSDISPLDTPNSHRARSQKYQQIVKESNSQAGRNSQQSVYQQAVCRASNVLEIPMAILSVFGETETIKAAIGLESLPFSNGGEISVQMLGIQGCSQYLEHSHQCLAVGDVQASTQYFAENSLIAAYLGVPLLTRGGDCLGTLAVMDKQVREFSARDRAMLELIGEWVVCELERGILLRAQVASFGEAEHAPVAEDLRYFPEAVAKFNLLTHLAQALRTPLTAVIGMTSVLQRELYGPLNDKQQSYANIIHHSGQLLVAVVDEINNLGGFEQLESKPVLKAVDIEMLCQQSLRDLNAITKQRRQHIELVIDSPQRIWLLDRDKVRLILYYLLLHTLQRVNPGGQVNFQVTTTADQMIVEITPTRTPNLRVLPGTGEPAIDITHTQLGLALSQVLTVTYNGSLEPLGSHGHRLTLPLMASGLSER